MSDAHIVTGYVPGVLGRVTELHASYYHRHWGFGVFFETRVAAQMSTFLDRFDPERDCFWCVMLDDRIEGSVTIDGVHAENDGAHLRWFITSDAARGQGMGGQLIDQAMQFCAQQHYSRIYLDTFRGLESARHLYEKAGFTLVESRIGAQWGTAVEEQRYEFNSDA